MKIAPELLKAYNKTLANASIKGKSEFLCSGINCSDCPFKNCECYTLGARWGNAAPRTTEGWREWFESLGNQQRC